MSFLSDSYRVNATIVIIEKDIRKFDLLTNAIQEAQVRGGSILALHD
jgi:hypothetical protein